VRAVDDETARADRLQSGKALGDPVFRCDAFEAQRLRLLVTRCCSDQRPQHFLVGRDLEIDRHAPDARPGFHNADRDLVLRKTLGDQIGDPARRLFTAFEHRDRE
jgi:hypothetical protein